VGPGFIVASVVLGPGSIIAASRAGAEAGYRLLWVLTCSVILMAVYTSMAGRLGCALDTTPLDFVARRMGRWLAFLAGLSGFLVVVGFQYTNNLAVAFAVSGIIGGPLWVWPLVFTALSIVFLACARELYRLLERAMLLLVVVMILSFVANLFWSGISVGRLFKGLVPRGFEKEELIIATAMLATTFSVIGAFYQAYLVRAKGWKREDIRTVVGDAWAGIFTLGLISAVILIGCAESLFGTGTSFQHIGQLAEQLKGVLGGASNFVFCCGLAAAAFSSFVVNAMVGASLMADGLGLDSRVNSGSTKALAGVALVIGCLVAVASGGKATTTSLLVAQASTLLAVPLCATLLLVLTSSRKVMGELRNTVATTLAGVVGLVMLLALAWSRLLQVVNQLQGLFQ